MMDDQNMEDAIVDRVAGQLRDVGNQYKLSALLKRLEGWQLSHKLELQYTSETELAQLKQEFGDPKILTAFVDAVNETLGLRLEVIETKLVPKPLHPSIVNQVEDILLEVEEKLMNWTTLEFGKHTGKTLPQVMFVDPDWFFWAFTENAFNGKGDLATEAQEIYTRARSIRIPQNADEKLVVEYFIHPITKDFTHFQLVPEARPKHNGASPTVRLEVVDMGLVREISSYDKGGYRRLINDIKAFIMKDPDIKMTKIRSEAFFFDDENFDI